MLPIQGVQVLSMVRVWPKIDKERICEVAVKWKLVSHVRLFATPYTLWDSPWTSPDQSTGVGSRSLLQGIFPKEGLNPGLLHCRRILYLVSHQESLRLQWLPAYQYSLNPTNLMELNTWKNVKRKPKVKISFNGKRAATKKEFLKPTKQAITVKINTQELNMDEMREWRDGDWAKLSSQT